MQKLWRVVLPRLLLLLLLLVLLLMFLRFLVLLPVSFMLSLRVVLLPLKQQRILPNGAKYKKPHESVQVKRHAAPERSAQHKTKTHDPALRKPAPTGSAPLPAAQAATWLERPSPAHSTRAPSPWSPTSPQSLRRGHRWTVQCSVPVLQPGTPAHQDRRFFDAAVVLEAKGLRSQPAALAAGSRLSR